MVVSIHVPFRRTRRSASISLAAMLVALAACGASRAPAPGSDDQLLSAMPARSTICVAEPYPEMLPGVAAVVDSGMLAAAVGELLRQDTAATGYVLLSLGFDPQGVNIRRDLVEHSTRPLVADSVQRLVFAARRSVREGEQEWGVRLRIDLGDRIGMRVGRREFCPPAPRDRQLEAVMHGFNPPGVRYRQGTRERVIQMRARVNASGIVTSAHIVRGDLSGSTLERNLAQHLRQFLFNPATVDGVPTGAWVEIPVRVRG